MSFLFEKLLFSDTKKGEVFFQESVNIQKFNIDTKKHGHI